MRHLELDHLVLVVPNLTEAIQYFKDTFNVTAVIGGRHVGFGTHNALLGLGQPKDLTYLELLAIDPEDKTYYDAYPMGISLKDKQMYFGSWCVRCNSSSDMGQANQSMIAMGQEYDHGVVRKMQRVTPSNTLLSWEIASRSEQVIASKGQVPFLIKWDDLSLHPTRQLAEENYIQYNLNFSRPDSKALEGNLKSLGFKTDKNIIFTDESRIITKLTLRGKVGHITFSGK